MTKKNYGFVLTGTIIIAAAFGIPILLGGFGFIAKIFQLLFTSTPKGDIPLWIYFVGGLLLFAFIKKDKRRL